MENDNKTVFGLLRIYPGGLARQDNGYKVRFYYETDVVILEEMLESVRIKYPLRFVKAHLDLCVSDIVQKDDTHRSISFNVDDVSKNALGVVRFYDSDLTAVSELLNPRFIETEVEILSESPEFFSVQYSALFRKEHPELCESDVVDKSDTRRRVIYTHFLASHPLVRRAIYTVHVPEPNDSPVGVTVKAQSTDVLIVDETQTHYRLRFTDEFARQHANLCQEWLRKGSTELQVI
jgi:hypothetical protein